MVPEAGLEPALPEEKGILSPPRLPIPPLGQVLNQCCVDESYRTPRKTDSKKIICGFQRLDG